MFFSKIPYFELTLIVNQIIKRWKKKKERKKYIARIKIKEESKPFLIFFFQIVGVSSSLGESLASEFLKNGCSVICVDKDSKTIEKTVSRLKERHLIVEARQRRDDLSRCGSMIFTYECDFLDKDAIRGTVQKVKKDIGRIDVLITCINESNENIFDASNKTLMAHFWVYVIIIIIISKLFFHHLFGSCIRYIRVFIHVCFLYPRTDSFDIPSNDVVSKTRSYNWCYSDRIEQRRLS